MVLVQLALWGYTDASEAITQAQFRSTALIAVPQLRSARSCLDISQASYEGAWCETVE